MSGPLARWMRCTAGHFDRRDRDQGPCRSGSESAGVCGDGYQRGRGPRRAADLQARRSPPQRRVRQLPDRAVTHASLAAATSTPLVVGDNIAGQHRHTCIQALAHGPQPQPVQAREGSQVRDIKGSVTHVEVFQVAGVGTFIFGRPRRLPPHRRAGHPALPDAPSTYTLIWEEPLFTSRRAHRHEISGLNIERPQ